MAWNCESKKKKEKKTATKDKKRRIEERERGWKRVRHVPWTTYESNRNLKKKTRKQVRQNIIFEKTQELSLPQQEQQRRERNTVVCVLMLRRTRKKKNTARSCCREHRVWASKLHSRTKEKKERVARISFPTQPRQRNWRLLQQKNDQPLCETVGR